MCKFNHSRGVDNGSPSRELESSSFQISANFTFLEKTWSRIKVMTRVGATDDRDLHCCA